MSNPCERYQKLALGEALSRIHLYKLACKELSFILRFAYNKLPKNLQSLIFQDTLAAFRLLPQMQSQTSASAANLLLRSAEVALPKQKKNLAITEFKHAKVAHKRRLKARQEEKDSAQLPQDVLVQIFSLLDVKSLASVGLVCWSWNSAASDNHLWRLQYDVFFRDSDACSKTKRPLYGTLTEDKVRNLPQEDTVDSNDIDWKEAFKRSVMGNSSKRLTCDRGYCGQCDAIVWLNETKHSSSHCGQRHESHQIKPISVRQVAEYLLDDSFSVLSSSDSDSDSDEGSVSRLWAYPKNINLHPEKSLM